MPLQIQYDRKIPAVRLENLENLRDAFRDSLSQKCTIYSWNTPAALNYQQATLNKEI